VLQSTQNIFDPELRHRKRGKEDEGWQGQKGEYKEILGDFRMRYLLAIFASYPVSRVADQLKFVFASVHEARTYSVTSEGKLSRIQA
jgi:hypothetical protein